MSRLGHWDENIRDLAGKALFKLTPGSKDQILGSVIPRLLERTLGPDLYMRQGSVIGLAEIMHALSSETTLPSSLLSSVEEIIPKRVHWSSLNRLTGFSNKDDFFRRLIITA
ncbi:unnamed protein product [Dibothriocephalus latus]|uniref:Uncharacterized protein n=1 Tax=Dibothriocephalus latus TaxID=60516 RepID=A0A3P7N2U2_DIBLA|nr:unnamed protein product [Dibothriocephalus latus]